MIAHVLAAALLSSSEIASSEISLTVTVLVGRPAAAAGAAVPMDPGTVLYAGPAAWAVAGEDSVARAEQYLTMTTQLKESYRLSSITPTSTKTLRLSVDETEVVPTVDGGPTLEITPAGVDANTARLKIRLTQGGALMAQPIIAIRRNGFGMVGSKDGAAAPYLFVILEDTTQRAARSVRPPKKVHDMPVQYPPEAKEAGVQGIVLVRCRLDAQGRIAHAEVVRGVAGELGAKLNRAALDAVRQWRYEPGVDASGTAVETEMTLTIQFRLP
jgi:TonB family protein